MTEPKECDHCGLKSTNYSLVYVAKRIAAVAMLYLVLALVIAGCKEDADRANRACESHGGVERASSTDSLVICRDGTAVDTGF